MQEIFKNDYWTISAETTKSVNQLEELKQYETNIDVLIKSKNTEMKVTINRINKGFKDTRVSKYILKELQQLIETINETEEPNTMPGTFFGRN